MQLVSLTFHSDRHQHYVVLKVKAKKACLLAEGTGYAA